jgi:GDPmannose 4,6-dehydratase
MPKALVTGVSGQDGWFMAEYLRSLGYEVLSVVRMSRYRLGGGEVPEGTRPVYGDISDPAFVMGTVMREQPDEIYNFAGQTFVAASWQNPDVFFRTNAVAVLYLCEAMRLYNPKTRLYIACSSEQFGETLPPQHEQSVMSPISVYGVSKKAAFDMGIVYQRSYGLPITCGVAFNHESVRRGHWFISQKVTRFIAMVRSGLVRSGERLKLGYKAGIRDWGSAKEYVRIMHAVVNKGVNTCVIGTAIGRTVEEFVQLAFDLYGLDAREWVEFDYFENIRPTEPKGFIADNRKIAALGLAPKVKIEEVLQEMTAAWEERFRTSETASLATG